MADRFRIIAITEPVTFDNEGALIELMLRRGVDRVHVRKPGADAATVMSLIRSVDESLWPRLSIHGFQSIAADIGAGIHLNAQNPTAPPGFGGVLSRSCHSLCELAESGVDYQFLSPVFDSISKQGYRGAFNPATLRVGARTLALGGVTPERFNELRLCGFGGAAMLGYFWADHSLETVKQRIDAAIHYSHE